MTPTPRSRAGSSVTSLPWSITFPVYGISKPAMTRRIVVLPLPDAPSKTNTSPSATSKLIFSSTLVLPKRLLIPTTLAAAGGEFAVDTGSADFGISVSLAFTTMPQSTSSQSRAKNRTLKIKNENNAKTIAIAFAASI